ncbi:ubiquinone biosynthesis protein [Bordetella trematum]|nr:ubiquinone biosynthesis protein [Bordetella trematum]
MPRCGDPRAAARGCRRRGRPSGWCDSRLQELGSRPSLLNPFWYAGSFALGVAASVAGVPRNLGFMAETERQVEAHLEEHLSTLPPADERSRQIVRQMKDDEAGHRESAERAGGVPLPAPVRGIMRAMSKVMTRSAYYV